MKYPIKDQRVFPLMFFEYPMDSHGMFTIPRWLVYDAPGGVPGCSVLPVVKTALANMEQYRRPRNPWRSSG